MNNPFSSLVVANFASGSAVSRFFGTWPKSETQLDERHSELLDVPFYFSI